MPIKLPKDIITACCKLDAVLPSPKIETARKPDGSCVFRVGYDANTIEKFVQEAASEMTNKIDAAVIDELLRLNGYVPERTCKPHGEWERTSQLQECRRVLCDCGNELGMDTRRDFPIKIVDFCELPNYCPNCGAKVVE